ncbi:MAG: AsnC family protein [Acidithiobacillus sp.]
MSARSSHLDDADRWLLQHDPLLSKASPNSLANRRIRQYHRQGGEYLNDVVVAEEECLPLLEDGPTTDRLVRLAPPGIRKLVALRMEFPSASQAELGRMLGCSRQAVHKKRQKLIAYLRAMATPPAPTTLGSGSGPGIPVFVRPGGQLAWDFEEDKK